ncbi:M20/M25/M40 family metallo-hydrolase [Streptomyces sp. NPDC001661]
MVHADSAHRLIDLRGETSIEEVRNWLRMPSFSDTGEGIMACARHTRELLGTVAADARIVETDGHPVVLGTVPAGRPDAPTLLVYGLYDVTPLVPEEWTVDPAAAPIVDAAVIGARADLGPVLVGRGANNHKGPVLASIMAVQALLDSDTPLPVNLIYVIEGEEEIGSPSMPAFVTDHRDLLETADGVWLPCMQQNSAGVMTLRRAYKGSLWAELICHGGTDGAGGPRDGRHVWAGNSAWIDAPMMRLVKALGTLFDDEQRLVVDGLQDALPALSDEELEETRRIAAAFDAHPEWEQRMRENLNVGQYLAGKPLSSHLDHYMRGCALNIQGISGGYQGPGYYTMMPGRAGAKLDLRFPPGIAPDHLASLVQAHLDARGYSDVRLSHARGYAGAPALPRESDTLLAAAQRTAQRGGVAIDVWPIANNCCPASLLTGLGEPVPFSIAGAGHGDRAHAPDEYITVNSVSALMHWTVDYLHDWAEIVAS